MIGALLLRFWVYNRAQWLSLLERSCGSLFGGRLSSLVGTQRLQWSSFWVLTCFRLRNENMRPKKGTTFGPLG